MDVKRKGAFLLAAVGFGALLSGAAVPSHAWKPDPALVKNLGPEVKLSICALRPPAKYAVEQESSGPVTVHAWKGAGHPNGAAPGMSIVIITVPPKTALPSAKSQSALSQLLQTSIEDLEKSRTDLKTSAPQFGTINGWPFARLTWKGSYSSGKGPILATFGFEYVTIKGQDTIEVRGMDVEPYGNKALDLMEASAMTIHVEGTK